jgi:hypothetical protein
LSGWLALSLPFSFIEAFVLPLLATEAPALAEGLLGMFTRSAGAMNFGVLSTLWALSDILFVFGSLVFGVATLRARSLSRWAAGMFTAGIALAPAYGLLPTALQPLVAVPIGLGLAWLGYEVWSERSARGAQRLPGRGAAQLSHTGAD